MISNAQHEADVAWLKASRERMLLQAEAERLAAPRQTMVERLQPGFATPGLTPLRTRPPPGRHPPRARGRGTAGRSDGGRSAGRAADRPGRQGRRRGPAAGAERPARPAGGAASRIRWGT